MFWYNKNHPNTIYIDKYPRDKNTSSLRPNFECKPDMVIDFTKLEFEDNKFKLVVFDPPHLRKPGPELKIKYGKLDKYNWQEELLKGFNECWRVLQDYGVLIFKWNEEEIPIYTIIKLFNQDPLFGHITGSKSKTHWLTYMKIPS